MLSAVNDQQMLDRWDNKRTHVANLMFPFIHNHLNHLATLRNFQVLLIVSHDC